MKTPNSCANFAFNSEASHPSTWQRIKFDWVGYGFRYGIFVRAERRRVRSSLSFSTSNFNSSTFASDACAATLAATLTLYGCLDFHKVGMSHLGNAP